VVNSSGISLFVCGIESLQRTGVIVLYILTAQIETY